MMNRSTKLLCILVTTAVFFVLTTPVLAGVTPTPPTATPATATPATATPPTVVPTPTAEPTCTDKWPIGTAFTRAKGQSTGHFGNNVNSLIIHAVTGNIIQPHRLSDTAHRIRVCEGTFVSSRITDRVGTPTSIPKGDLTCVENICSGVINVKSSYTTTSDIGTDKDTITLLPQDGFCGSC